MFGLVHQGESPCFLYIKQATNNKEVFSQVVVQFASGGLLAEVHRLTGLPFAGAT